MNGRLGFLMKLLATYGTPLLHRSLSTVHGPLDTDTAALHQAPTPVRVPALPLRQAPPSPCVEKAVFCNLLKGFSSIGDASITSLVRPVAVERFSAIKL